MNGEPCNGITFIHLCLKHPLIICLPFHVGISLFQKFLITRHMVLCNNMLISHIILKFFLILTLIKP